MTAFTPGPWRWTAGGQDVDPATYKSPGLYDNLELVGPGGEYILSADGGTYRMLGHAPDAALIAAAPALYAALQAALSVLEDAQAECDWDWPVIAEVRAALALAEGKDSKP